MRRSNYKTKNGKTLGPKPKYTQEFLDDLADKMLATIKKDKSILFIRDYFSSVDILYNTIWSVMGVSDKFAAAYVLCRQICSDRVHKGVLQNKLNGHYARSLLPFFDPELAKEMRAQKKLEMEDALAVSTEANLKESGYKVILHIDKE